MNSIADSMRVSVPAAQRFPTRNRAEELVKAVLLEYNVVKRNTQKSGQSVNLICSVGQQQFDVYNIGVRGSDFVSVLGKTEDGTEFKTIAPVEQVSFTIVLSKKFTPEPPREIGFEAIRKEREKAEQAE